MPTRRQLERWTNRARASSLAALKRQEHFDRRDKEARVTRRKPKFIGEVSVINLLDGSPEEGKVIGTAKIEKLGNSTVVHIDGNTISGEVLRRGFSLDSVSFIEDEFPEYADFEGDIVEEQ